MNSNPEYRILAAGHFRPSQVVQRHDPNLYRADYSFGELEAMDLRWIQETRRAEQQGRMVYSTDLFRLAEVRVEGDNLHLSLGNTEYKDYVATRDPIEAVTRANPLGSVVIATTADGYIPFCWRAAHLDVNPGKLFGFGGFFDRALDLTDAGEPDVFACIRRELKEELGNSNVQTLHCVGVVYDCLHPHPEIAFSAKLADTRARLQTELAWSDEVGAMVMVHRDELTEFLRDRRTDVCSTLRGAIELFTTYG